jgi:acyl carrier protein
MTELQERLYKMAHDTFGADSQAMRDGASFEELDIDSLALIEFTIDIQREFEVPIVEGQLKSDFTVADLAELLSSMGVAT